MAFVHGIQDHAGGFDHEALSAHDSFHAFDTDSQILIGSEQAGDAARREALLDSAFGRKERFAKTCQRIRDGRVPAHGLSLVARKDGAFIGTLRMWHVDAGGVPALLLGPLAVDAAHRSEGIGGMLMDEALDRATRLGHRAVILVGDAPYYARWGFSRAPVLKSRHARPRRGSPLPRARIARRRAAQSARPCEANGRTRSPGASPAHAARHSTRGLTFFTTLAFTFGHHGWRTVSPSPFELAVKATPTRL